MIYLYGQSWLGVEAIVLWPFVLFRKPKDEVPERLMKHEQEHVRQVYRGLIVGFYLSYVWEYLKLRIRGYNHSDAYWLNPYETQARAAEFKP